MMAKGKRIVILGGAASEAMDANCLRTELSTGGSDITVIERSENHLYQPSFLALLFGIDSQKYRFQLLRKG